VVAASTLTVGRPEGRICSRTAEGADSNLSHEGSETTDVWMPSPASSSCAATATDSSLPVATIVAAGEGWSRTTPAPISTAEPSVMLATVWRDSTSAVGPSCRTARTQASRVSFGSAGRITCRPGMARNVARCSTGWCVGPSSPTPTESWLKTKTQRARESAASLSAGRR